MSGRREPDSSGQERVSNWLMFALFATVMAGGALIIFIIVAAM